MRLIQTSLSEVAKYAAYWAKGKIVYEVDTKHIQFILLNPEMFDLTLPEIRAVYKKHGEKIGQEGKAREEIIKMVASNRWIRIRHYKTPQDYWTVQFDNYRKRKRSVGEFIDYALENLKMSMNDTISLLGYEDGYSKTYDFMSGGVSAFLMERKRRKKSL